MATETADPIIDSIRSELEGIEEQLRSYEDLVARRARLRAMLDIATGDVAVPTGAGRADAFRAATSRRSRAGAFTASQIDENAIVSFVGAHEPVGAGQIGKHVGASGNALSMKLKSMVDAGVLSKQGERRATVYGLAVGGQG